MSIYCSFTRPNIIVSKIVVSVIMAPENVYTVPLPLILKDGTGLPKISMFLKSEMNMLSLPKKIPNQFYFLINIII